MFLSNIWRFVESDTLTYLFHNAAHALSSLVDSGRPWIQKYGLWAVGLGLVTETLVFTGIVVPGFGILVAAGYLVADGVLPLLPTLLLAWGGALLGDQMSYAVGHLWGHRLFHKKKRLLERMNRSLEDEGSWLLLFYHYAPWLRAVLPCAAGTIGYRFHRWVIFDSLGVLIWVMVALGMGYSAHGALKVQGGIASQVINAFATLVTVFVTVRVFRRMKSYRNSTVSVETDASDHL